MYDKFEPRASNNEIETLFAKSPLRKSFKKIKEKYEI